MDSNPVRATATFAAMPAYVALLRGINVGGNRMIKMADLRAVFVAADADDVATYIQSGNVVFTHAARSEPTLAAELEKRIAKAAGFPVPVVLRSAAQLARVIEDSPFPDADTDHLHVAFLAARPPSNTPAIDARAFAPECYAAVGRELYLYLPDGMGRSRLAAAVLAKPKAIGAGGTARNWRTVLKLNELASAR
ncbi:MAG: DUF1697 domain-containing protein [Chloroflexota bacterium]|nr:DUF1697 domain-containing protein [Chloroflexota bacterium]